MLSKKLFLSSIVLFVLLSSPLVVLVEAEPSWVIWSQTYGGTKEDCANSLIETSDEGYALTGNTRSFGAEDEDFWLVKTDGSGNMEWNQTYGEGEVTSLVETSDGGYTIAGSTRSFGAEDEDFWLIKTNEQGVPEFPSWAPLLVMLVVVMAVAVIYRRNLYKQTRGRMVH